MPKAYKPTYNVRVENKAVGWIGALGKAEEPSRTLSGTQGEKGSRKVERLCGKRRSDVVNELSRLSGK